MKKAIMFALMMLCAALLAAPLKAAASADVPSIVAQGDVKVAASRVSGVRWTLSPADRGVS